MIRLIKQPEPKVLQDNAEQWLKVLEDKLSVGETPTDAEKARYRHPDIKAALKLETHGKCAYCESHLLHIAFGDVEHISPKSLNISDTFRWNNLTLACDVCNTYKKDSTNIVDPYDDDPEIFFKFLGPMIYAHPEHDKGVVTAIRLKLNRADLVENRSKKLQSISHILLTISETKNPEIRKVLLDDLIDTQSAKSNEYSAFVRSFLAVVIPKLVDADAV